MGKVIQFFTNKYDDKSIYTKIKAKHTAIVLMLICFDVFLEMLFVFFIGENKQEIITKDAVALLMFVIMLLVLKSGHIILTGNLLILGSVYELILFFPLGYTFQFYLQCLLAITFCVAIYIKNYQLYLLLISTITFTLVKLSYLPKQITAASQDFYSIKGEIVQLTIAVIFYIIIALFFDRIIKREIDSGKRLQELAETDVLTAMYNREKFDETIQTMLTTKQPFYLAFFDLDFFKKINDTYGHMTGDHVLQAFSKTMQQEFGESVCYRWGGEEFAFVCVCDDRDAFIKKLEGFMGVLHSKNMVSDIKVTVSIGWVYNDLSMTKEQMLANVDRALYLAKSNGRDRIEEVNDSDGRMEVKE